MTTSVALSILTFRRRDHLARSLRSAHALGNDLSEIVVVDNAAETSLADWLRNNFPNVRYLPMKVNAGCDGRNAALREVRAQVLITLDDDVELVSANVARLRQAFDSDADLACVNFQVLGPEGDVLEREWCHPRPISHATREFETCFILEGACALRRSAVLEAGGYPAKFFIGHEGLDLAYRLINRGKRIVYHPAIQVKHHVAPEERPGWRVYYYYTRNGLWIAYRFFSGPAAVWDALENTSKMAFFALRAGHLPALVSGLIAGVREIPATAREPLSRTALARLKAIRSERATLWRRVERHLRERIL